ncbi:universal stress protein family 4 [Halorhodospira halochloris]|uniref:Universal stress protein family 4 n=1 Tax=Halorhodospira halochloris TaxID=1052 RepID=A0A0X8X8K9_HALHR|nr:universal stress protein [Halorhodospira halochloris]BAU57500.2 universal stress protein family 4 [Halorhodospira halochloris]
MQKVLLATDLSAHGDRAGRRAVQLVRRREVELRVVHVIQADLEEDALRRLFGDSVAVETLQADLLQSTQETISERLAGELAGTSADYSVSCIMGRGHPEISAQAQEWGAELVVIGAHGHHGVRDFFLGTTAESLVHDLKQSVLIVKSSSVADYRRVVVPVDFSQRSLNALQFARILAPQAVIEVVHVFDTTPFERLYRSSSAGSQMRQVVELGKEESRQKLARWISDSGSIGHEIASQSLRCGYPPKEIVAAAEESNADLIVLGTRGLSHWRGAMAGSVARRVLQQAECDVALERCE